MNRTPMRPDDEQSAVIDLKYLCSTAEEHWRWRMRQAGNGHRPVRESWALRTNASVEELLTWKRSHNHN